MTPKTRFRMTWHEGQPKLEVWVDHKGWEAASSRDFVHQEIELDDQIELEIPEEKGK